jgi:hypothetical protein
MYSQSQITQTIKEEETVQKFLVYCYDLYTFMFKVCVIYLHTVLKMYTAGLTLDHMTLVLQALFNLSGHAMGQLLEQEQGEVADPHHLDCPLQLGQKGDGVVPLQPGVFNGPHILNRIQIRRLSGPARWCMNRTPTYRISTEHLGPNRISHWMLVLRNLSFPVTFWHPLQHHVILRP